ncbi:hypothetical protein CPC08DRAFT_35815 [Agrocybe pediades]|nr:hypothetical protein CPC08DRAFT_35815 [Agrocybe pediades]
MSIPHQLNHDASGYVAVTFSPASSFISSPASLVDSFPGLKYHGKVGQLDDVHLYSMEKQHWLQARSNVLGGLENHSDILHVEEQTPRQRGKRGGDEL